MKKVVITGATGGIGQALCLEFAKAGYDIILQYNSNEEKAEEICRQIEKQGVSAQKIKADFTKTEDVLSFGSQVGEVYALINNAGLAYQSLFQFADEKKVQDLFDVNLFSAMTLTKEILPAMIKNQGGRIINISSMWGISGASCEVHYSASKSALIGFTKALAKEVGPTGITVNCIAPGFIDTPMNKNIDEGAVKEIVENTPISRKGKGEDVAHLAVFLASEKASFITGQIISVDGGYGV